MMKGKDVREITVWAVVTLIVVMGVFGTRTAQSQGPAMGLVEPSVMVDGVKITASVKAVDEPYKVLLTVSATNTGTKTQKIEPHFIFTRSDFTGSPLSRVYNPNDYKKTIEETVKMSLTVPASKTVNRTVTVPIAARLAEPKQNAPGQPIVPTTPPSYNVTLEGQKEAMPLANFSASIAWPKK
jgi:hypothetical protein